MRPHHGAILILVCLQLCGCEQSAESGTETAQAAKPSPATSDRNMVQSNAEAVSPYCSSGGSEAQANCQSKVNALSAVVAPAPSKPTPAQ